MRTLITPRAGISNRMATEGLCEVCGWRGEDDVCPRCGTILHVGRALCRVCKREIRGPIARCTECGSAEPLLENAPAESIARLTQLPGIDDRAARWLYGRGYWDPADVLKLALPERAIRMGMHRTLARKMTLTQLTVAPRIRKEVPCPMCETPKASANAVCPACGARGEREPSPEEIQKQLAEVVGEVQDLAADPDFLEMPADLREEILDAFETVGAAIPVPEAAQTFERQFSEWRARGIDTAPLEQILHDEGEVAFRSKFAAIVRRQLAKRRDDGRFWCPVCDEELSPHEGECENCGAKFK